MRSKEDHKSLIQRYFTPWVIQWLPLKATGSHVFLVHKLVHQIASELDRIVGASKLVRLGVFKDRASVNAENEKRGGNAMATLEHDEIYTIYIVRDPNTKAPIYVGQSQNFRKRKKSHVRRFSTLLAGQIPLIEEVETVETYALAREAARAIIAELSNAGYILRNVLDREEGNV